MDNGDWPGRSANRRTTRGVGNGGGGGDDGGVAVVTVAAVHNLKKAATATKFKERGRSSRVGGAYFLFAAKIQNSPRNR